MPSIRTKNAMLVLFCCDSFESHLVDSLYTREAEAAKSAGLDVELLSYDALVEEEAPERAVRRVTSRATPTHAIYRGWMLTPSQYTDLYHVLEQRGVLLLNDPTAYKNCHWLPESYGAIQSRTARSVWLPKSVLSMDRLASLLTSFGDNPVVVKDYVKSRKHEWLEACFVPKASDSANATRVLARFLELQGDDLQGGVVIREFLPLQSIGAHPKSGMPMAAEFRAFFLRGRLLTVGRYWDEGTYDIPEPDMDEFACVAAAVESSFFTMDVARLVGGGWRIVELGDAQVSALPDDIDPIGFFRKLADIVGG